MGHWQWPMAVLSIPTQDPPPRNIANLVSTRGGHRVHPGEIWYAQAPFTTLAGALMSLSKFPRLGLGLRLGDGAG